MAERGHLLDAAAEQRVSGNASMRVATPKSQVFKLALTIVLLVSASCLVWLLMKRMRPPVIDLAKSRSLDQVNWPTERRNEAIWTETYNHRIIVRFDDTHIFDGKVVWVTLGQKRGAVSYIQLGLVNQSASEVLETAKKIAQQWGLPTDPLDEWYKRVSDGEHEVTAIHGNDLPNQPSIEIRSSYEPGKPYWIIYSIFW